MSSGRNTLENILRKMLLVIFFLIFTWQTDNCHPNNNNIEHTLPRNNKMDNFTYSFWRHFTGVFNNTFTWPDQNIIRTSTTNIRKSVHKRNEPTEDRDNYIWPIKQVAEIKGDIVLGGLMMIHEREDKKICGPIMPQGGIQALECMLYTIDWINSQEGFLPGFKLGAYVLDDCDKDTYGLEQAVDFIKGMQFHI
ncbi:uncharacterized protein LOC118185141 [Stegodyphus dumicola]|uniref:uncharacterized protein LOC118185141 n=1 Tax=Stegodyphus dumicola TaxID=202533 RepID=UPI0015A76145|nr:uncharacterized protein LOC118185141 [Stegodyphus dumicola]